MAAKAEDVSEVATKVADEGAYEASKAAEVFVDFARRRSNSGEQ